MCLWIKHAYDGHAHLDCELHRCSLVPFPSLLCVCMYREDHYCTFFLLSHKWLQPIGLVYFSYPSSVRGSNKTPLVSALVNSFSWWVDLVQKSCMVFHIHNRSFYFIPSLLETWGDFSHIHHEVLVEVLQMRPPIVWDSTKTGPCLPHALEFLFIWA